MGASAAVSRETVAHRGLGLRAPPSPQGTHAEEARRASLGSGPRQRTGREGEAVRVIVVSADGVVEEEVPPLADAILEGGQLAEEVAVVREDETARLHGRLQSAVELCLGRGREGHGVHGEALGLEGVDDRVVRSVGEDPAEAPEVVEPRDVGGLLDVVGALEGLEPEDLPAAVPVSMPTTVRTVRSPPSTRPQSQPR